MSSYNNSKSQLWEDWKTARLEDWKTRRLSALGLLARPACQSTVIEYSVIYNVPIITVHTVNNTS